MFVKITDQMQCFFQVYYEPTDVNKASKPFLSESWRALTCISPNLRELRAISQTLGNPVPTGEAHLAMTVTKKYLSVIAWKY